MKADDFARELARCTPTIDKYISWGYSTEFAEKRRESFFLKEKTPETPELDDSLVDLICRYDTRRLEIRGGVVLGKTDLACSVGPDKILVGAMEADPLVIDAKTGAVKLLDHADPRFVIARCANSGAAFLEALLSVANFEPPYVAEDLRGDLTKEQAVANNKAARKCAEECAKVAGISEKPNIYETLLGCDCWTA